MYVLSFQLLGSVHSSSALKRDIQLYAWKHGLKTGLYYLRTAPPADPQPYGISHRYVRAAAPLGLPAASLNQVPFPTASSIDSTEDGIVASPVQMPLDPAEDDDLSDAASPVCPCDA